MTIPFVDIHTHHDAGSAYAIVNLDLLLQIPDEIAGHYHSYGIHPWWFDDHPQPEFLEQQLQLLEQLLRDNRLAAIGETGIDKLHEHSLQRQKESFEQHILLSEQYHKPLIIHNVRGTQLLMDLHKKHHPQQVWIIHGFNGSAEEIKQLTQKGCHLSVGESLLHKNRKIHQSIKSIPLEYLFFETDTSDCPIEDLYQKAAERMEMPLELLKTKVFDNYKRCFGIS